MARGRVLINSLFHNLCPKGILSHIVRMIQPINTQLQRMTVQLSSEDDCVIQVPEKTVQSHGYSGLENGNILIFKMGEKAYDQGQVSSRMSSWYK